MRWKCLAGLLLALLPMSSGGQDIEQTVPFRLEDGFIWLEVRTAKMERPLSFILDSGAGVSVLDTATVRELGLRKGLKVAVDGVSAQVTGFWPQRLQASLGEIRLPRQYLALDLQELSQGCHRRVDGLLGMDFFRDRVVQIDYANRWLRILGGKASMPPGEELPLTLRHCGMLVPVSVGGAAPAFLRVDTGCASWLHWTAGKVNGLDCSSRVAVGLVKMSLHVVKTTIATGKTTFADVPAEIHEQPIFPGEGGLLGNRLLAQFSAVTFDLPGKRLVLHGQPQAAGVR